ncbi:hypothetical protein LINPERPRIM_LOCUS5926 [Linum perenne]
MIDCAFVLSIMGGLCYYGHLFKQRLHFLLNTLINLVKMIPWLTSYEIYVIISVVFWGFHGGTGTAAEITSTGTTNTKRTRRKKKLAELGEEECFLWKEWRLSGNRQKNRKEDW